MRLKSIIKSNHDLKKNGYQIIAKLHKMEAKKNLSKVYGTSCNEGYYFAVACKNLAELISSQYDVELCRRDIDNFNKKSQIFLAHLDDVAERKGCINKGVLASYLHAYTQFFNTIIEMSVPFSLTQNMLVQWNVRCVMAYVTAWSA